MQLQRQAEERISEVMWQQQAILDNIPSIAWLKDRVGRYVAVNDPFGNAFGVAPKNMVGKNDYDIYPPELAVKYEKDSREVMTTGTRTYFEESITDREGNIQYLEKIETPIFNDTGVVIGIIGIASAENKDQLAEALKLSDERMYRDKSAQKEL